jgi:hypothetical protein
MSDEEAMFPIAYTVVEISIPCVSVTAGIPGSANANPERRVKMIHIHTSFFIDSSFH